MPLEHDVITVKGGRPPVTAPGAIGHRIGGLEIMAYDYATGIFFLSGGSRVGYLEAAERELEPPDPTRSLLCPALGKYATCWLGDCIVTSLDGRRAVVRTTCGKYAVAPRLLRPLRTSCSVSGTRVLYGSGRCVVFPSLTFTGGAMAMLEVISSTMAQKGLVVHGEPKLLELQAADGPAVALRSVSGGTRMLLQLRADVQGTHDGSFDTMCECAAPVALAHLTIEDYLHGNPWALPISHEMLRARLGVEYMVDTTLLHGPYTSVDGCLYLEAPQRPLARPPFKVDAEMIVLGVRAGRLEPQSDGTYVMPYAHGGWGQVVERGVTLRELMWQLDDLYDKFLPLGTHTVDLPGCPDCLLLERFGGEAYDPATRTVRSMV